jgi:Putative addiction module component
MSVKEKNLNYLENMDEVHMEKILKNIENEMNGLETHSLLSNEQIEELLNRKNNLKNNPSSGKTWEEIKNGLKANG